MNHNHGYLDTQNIQRERWCSKQCKTPTQRLYTRAIKEKLSSLKLVACHSIMLMHASLSEAKMYVMCIFYFILFLRFYLFIFREGKGEREGEKHQCVAASTGDLACNPSMCPDGESNPRHVGLQAGAQSTEPHQPGLHILKDISVKQI